MEGQAVIKALAYQLLEVCNRNGGDVGSQFYHNVARLQFAVFVGIGNRHADIIGSGLGGGKAIKFTRWGRVLKLARGRTMNCCKEVGEAIVIAANGDVIPFFLCAGIIDVVMMKGRNA